MRTILRRALFAWLIADGDMHLKNMALLKIAMPGASSFETVRLAPLYDAVTTRVFPGLEHDHMALKLAGKDDRLRRADFLKLAAVGGINATEAKDEIDAFLEAFAQALDTISLPSVPGIRADDSKRIDRMLKLCRERLLQFE